VSQRASGYERKADDAYYTPPWVTKALIPHLRIRPPARVREPAAGNNAIVDVLTAAGFLVSYSDITHGINFLDTLRLAEDAVITNPPYNQSEEFIAHALDLTEPHGLVAMLLRTDYDHAATRAYLFDNEPFARKVVLRKRIRWIPGSTGSPSFNHAWFVWDWRHRGPATIGYAR
jgi:CRISPR-associated DxTHG motif protein